MKLLEYCWYDEESFVVLKINDITGLIVKSNNNRFPVGELYYDYQKYQGACWIEYNESIILTNKES